MKRGGFQGIEIRFNICYTLEEEVSIERVLRRGDKVSWLFQKKYDNDLRESLRSFKQGLKVSLRKKSLQKISKELAEDSVVMLNVVLKVQCCVCDSLGRVFFHTK